MKNTCSGCAREKIRESSRICKTCINPETKEHQFWDNSDHARVHAILAEKNFSYNYCGICGYTPHTNSCMPNYAPVKWWDPDDGYKIGTLCQGCAEHNLLVKPSPDDFAYTQTNWVCDDENTDEDPTDALTQ